VERMKGIEPSSEAWEATALPLSYIRKKNTLHNLADCWVFFKTAVYGRPRFYHGGEGGLESPLSPLQINT